MIGQSDRADPLDSEHPNIFSQMVIGDQVEAARSEPETIRVYFTPGRVVARSGKVADLGCPGFINGLGNQVDGLFMRRYFLCGPRPIEKMCSMARTYSWPWGGSALALCSTRS